MVFGMDTKQSKIPSSISNNNNMMIHHDQHYYFLGDLQSIICENVVVNNYLVEAATMEDDPNGLVKEHWGILHPG
jgi:hypothetical protein